VKALEKAEATSEPEAVTLDPVQAEKAQVVKAMATADHFLGLLNFNKAADLLEEKLAEISRESSPHKGSDLHVEVLRKYAGILWWDGDLEGTLDAFTAADEVLGDRPEDPDVQQRRTEIWGQLAQVYRSAGLLDQADERLTAAVTLMLKLAISAEESAQSPLESEQPKVSSGTAEMLREMLASLAQICVQKKDFGRAEQLYLAAFAPVLDSSFSASSSSPENQAESAETLQE